MTTQTKEQQAVALAEWTVIAPDGKRFTGPSPLKAALPASRYHLEIDPEAQKKFLQSIEAIRAEGAAEREECLSKYGTLDCPACHGSGHIADAEPFRQQVREAHTAELVAKAGMMPKVWRHYALVNACSADEVREAIAAMQARQDARDAEWKQAFESASHLAQSYHAQLEQSQARVAELERDNAAIRQLLGATWCAPRFIHPYTDDGQFFDGSENPNIDFMADSPEEIKRKMVTRMVQKRAAMKKGSGV